MKIKLHWIFPISKDEIAKDILRLGYPLISKDTCWSYENEFRIIHSAEVDGEKGHIYDLKDFGLYINKIIVGALCEEKHALQLKLQVEQINKKRFEICKSRILKSIACTPEILDNIGSFGRMCG